MVISAQSAQNSVIAASPAEKESLQPLDLCIICDGAVGLAVGSIAGAAGQNIRICPINENEKSLSTFVDRLPLEFEIRERGANVGVTRGSTHFTRVSGDLASMVKGADGIIVTQRITEYGALVERLATMLVNGQTVCLINAPLGAGLQFKQLMRRCNKELQLNIIEVGKLFDSARVEDGVLLVSGPREKVSFCGNSRNETRRGLAIVNAISQGLVPSSNVIERGLSEVERILRPVFLLMALLGGRSGELDNIGNLVNPGMTKLIVCLDGEIQAMAKVYQVVVPSFLETLTHFGGVAWEDADCLGQALINIAGNLLEQRLIDEMDQPLSSDLAAELLKSNMIETFTLLSEFARLSRMRVPVINSLIDLASILTMTDLEKAGRKLSDLGLLGFDVQEIVEMINA